MTPHELIIKLIETVGPCGRICCYCDEVYDVAEMKECVENMLKEIYLLRSEKEMLMKDLIKIQSAYKEETGKDFIFKE